MKKKKRKYTYKMIMKLRKICQLVYNEIVRIKTLDKDT